MRNREDKILLFVNALEAAKFYVRLHDMNINLEFTALAWSPDNWSDYILLHISITMYHAYYVLSYCWDNS